MRQSFDETTDPSFGAKHLPLVRAKMAEQGLDGLLVPHEDEHQNEYLPEANDRLAWLTGFTGSAGAGVVMKDRAAVFTDGRYTVQVKAQVDADQFELRDLVEGGVPAYLEQAPKGAVIGYDPRLHSPDALATLRRAAAKAGAELRPVEANPVDLAWGDARPAQPTAPVVPHPERYAGESSVSKRARIGEAIAKAEANIAMPINVRGAFAGTALAAQQSQGQQAMLILAALVVIYIVLGILYESLVHPITVLSTLPSAGVGAVLALLMFRMEFSIIALIGVFLLIGIVKKNAILIIDLSLIHI